MRFNLPPALAFALFSTVVCALATALCIVDLMHARSVAVDVARRAAENLTQSLARQGEETFDAADGALRTLTLRVERDGLRSAQRTRLRETMAALITTMPRIHNLSIADEHGRLVVSNNIPASAMRFPWVADRPYFQFHRAHRDRDVYVSGPAISKLDGSAVLFASRRIDHPDGSFAGIAIAPISLTYFERSFADVDVGRSGTIALVAGDGMLVARRPHAFIGQRVDEAAVRSREFAHALGVAYIGTSPVDGVRRLVAFRKLDRYPLAIEVGLAEDEYLAAWHADALANYLALAGGTALLGALASGLGAQMTRRKRAEDALALSNTDVLTGLANRRRFEADLDREWARAARERRHVGLILIEVSPLRAYNERYGHAEGDNFLIAIARTCGAHAQPGRDVAARYDGLVFAVLLPGADEEATRDVAARVRTAIKSMVADAGLSGGPVPLSIGHVSLAAERTQEPAILVDAAFSALNAAKADGYGEAAPLLPVDALTGLANRRRFDAELEARWRCAGAAQQPVGLIVVGIDNLKAFNERHGREVGDDLLVSLARAIAAIAGEDNLAARYSALGFAVLLPATGEAAARIAAERLQQALDEIVARHSDVAEATVDVACGAASLRPGPAGEPSMLVATAFVALHQARRARSPRTANGVEPAGSPSSAP